MLGHDAFDSHMRRWLGDYTSAGDGFRYPGERAAASEKERRADGIPLGTAVVDQLRGLGRSLAVPFDLVAVRD